MSQRKRFSISIIRYLYTTFIIIGLMYFAYSYLHRHEANVTDDLRNSTDYISFTRTSKCVKTKLLLNKYRTTVCTHNVVRNRDISGSLMSAGIWEEYSVTHLLRILSKHRQYAFFDIGANIGVYTLYAAVTGCSNVISIECFFPNIDLIRQAIGLEHVEEHVVLVPRALYNKSDVYLSLQENIRNNVLSQYLNEEVVKNDTNPFLVRTIRFDDLLPTVYKRNIREAIIKIDIERSEHYLCETGEQMFNYLNIPFVMMEWANIKAIPERATLIRSFFTSRQYLPYAPETCQLHNETDYSKWNSQYIYWIKHNYAYLCKL
ncbi:unnamed protein product [Adineta ricciae]|uniref:Methyltransferase FkbM domain-containing protein n=1 Tax=Adineta ricciae TaxID=249248 RepID=A0A813XTP0_ADIRI|nr:unnamed protein product [Adineta ricciae]CAF1105132.1 unnamed protein product [Adineta ricciae]